MNFQGFSYAVAAIMVILVVILLYGAVKTWKVGDKFTSLINFLLACVVGYATYALYGEMIINLFK